jgi:hypothetical protein
VGSTVFMASHFLIERGEKSKKLTETHKKQELGEFTMVSQPIRLILVDWLYPKDFLFRARLFQLDFFIFFLWNPKIICMAPQF